MSTSENNSERLVQIRRKIAELKALDSDFSVFGSSSHRYLLNPTKSEQDIADFE